MVTRRFSDSACSLQTRSRSTRWLVAWERRREGVGDDIGPVTTKILLLDDPLGCPEEDGLPHKAFKIGSLSTTS